MKKKTSMQIIVIIVLTIILGCLVKITIDSINNKISLNYNMSLPNSNYQGKMNNSSDVTYSANKEITESTTLKDEEYTSINVDENAISIAENIDVTIADSKIIKTGDSYINSLEDSDTSYSNIDFNGYKLYVNGVAIN